MSQEHTTPFSTETSDMNYRVVVEDHSLYVNKDQLTALSPIFNNMANENNKQGYIELKCRNFNDILELFDILFATSTPIALPRKLITLENVEKMITFADEYNIEPLRVKLRDYMWRLSLKNLNRNDCLKYINWCWKIGNCPNVLAQFVPFLCSLNPSDYVDLPQRVLIAVYEAKCQRISTGIHNLKGLPFHQCGHCHRQTHLHCSNCDYCEFCLVKSPSCRVYHEYDCPNSHVIESFRKSKCLCGYIVDESILMVSETAQQIHKTQSIEESKTHDRKINSFSTATCERDFQVKVEQQDLYIGKDQLAAVSPVFDRMINGGFAEGKQGFVELKDKNFADVLTLFNILFLPMSDEQSITWENIETMISFADEYDIEKLRIELHKYLSKSLDHLIVGNEFCLKYLNYALQIGNCLDVVKQCVPFICALKCNEIVDLSNPLLIAVGEAKCKRATAVRHTFYRTRNIICRRCTFTLPSDVYCSKCGYCVHCLDNTICRSFHKKECPNSSLNYALGRVTTEVQCLCGYEFDESVLI